MRVRGSDAQRVCPYSWPVQLKACPYFSAGSLLSYRDPPVQHRTSKEASMTSLYLSSLGLKVATPMACGDTPDLDWIRRHCDNIKKGSKKPTSWKGLQKRSLLGFCTPGVLRIGELCASLAQRSPSTGQHGGNMTMSCLLTRCSILARLLIILARLELAGKGERLVLPHEVGDIVGLPPPQTPWRSSSSWPSPQQRAPRPGPPAQTRGP